jgi:hypothetical protein
LPPEHEITSGHGWSEVPKPGWRRLRWAELGTRLNVDPFSRLVMRSEERDGGNAFGFGSWPIRIDPPPEGSLDRGQYLRLVEHLTANTPDDGSTCLAHYGPLATSAFVAGREGRETRLLYRGHLRDLTTFATDERFGGSPTNISPDDCSWLVYTDYDRSATQVSGSAALIDRLTQDSELETVVLVR